MGVARGQLHMCPVTKASKRKESSIGMAKSSNLARFQLNASDCFSTPCMGSLKYESGLGSD